MESTFISKWREQGIWFAPRELATMALIILNKVLKTYQSMVHLWWVTVLFFVAVVFEHHYHLIPVVALTLYGLFVLLLSRASVPPKNFRYIFSSKKTVIAALLFIVLLILNTFSWSFPESWRYSMSIALGWHKDVVILSPLLRLGVLCLLDAHLAIAAQGHAVWRAGKIFLYHYPFFISVYLVAWYLIHPLIAYAISALSSSFIGLFASEYVALMLWLPWYSAAIVYGYIRATREHMDYYY